MGMLGVDYRTELMASTPGEFEITLEISEGPDAGDRCTTWHLPLLVQSNEMPDSRFDPGGIVGSPVGRDPIDVDYTGANIERVQAWLGIQSSGALQRRAEGDVHCSADSSSTTYSFPSGHVVLETGKATSDPCEPFIYAFWTYLFDDAGTAIPTYQWMAEARRCD